MINLDRWQEIISTVRRHRFRTVLTIISVSWGIFMLVLLVGAGRGLQNGVQNDFKDDAVNSIWLSGGRSSLPFKGLAAGRPTLMRNADYDYLRQNQVGVERISSRFRIGSPAVAYGDKTSTFDIRSTHPDHLYLEKTQMIEGRFLNELDLLGLRKVAVIGVDVADFLFGQTPPIGKYINVGSQSYRVVGVFEDEGQEDEQQKVYLPITTAQMSFGASDRAHQILFTVDERTTLAESLRMEEQVRATMAARHGFAVHDRQAIRIRNNVEAFARITEVFDLIEVFVWLVSAGTIIAGIVGVSNIMLISVKERTKEFGVRKALGAPPGSIVAMVVQESVFITAIGGYLGLIAGVGALEAISAFVPSSDYFANPTVDLAIAIKAILLLITTGALAGYFPARRAARIDPVVALRDG